MKKTAIIIGAGPAGLTAAFELLEKTDIIPIVIEEDAQVGGLSKTLDFKGNKIDIGGHRFFSKSERVLNWWLRILPLEEGHEGENLQIQYQHARKRFRQEPTNQPPIGEAAMMLRPRKSRIYHHKRFYDYPLRLNSTTIANLGLVKMMRIGVSYAWARIFPQRPETNLAQFFRNRFGKELYLTFFKDYTEKVWGVPCESIPAGWGQQRVKDLDIVKVLRHAIGSIFKSDKSIAQKNTSTSLIEQFLYPRLGPGQMWEAVAEEIKKRGGQILLNTSVTALHADGNNRIVSADIKQAANSTTQRLDAAWFFSSMPVRTLVANLSGISIPAAVRKVAGALEYRDFLIVGILADALAVKEAGNRNELISDNWIYVQDSTVRAGRIQVFNNWSPYMISDPSKVWIGVEYFCNETDAFWQRNDTTIAAQAVEEMESIGILRSEAVKDTFVVRVKKAYPSYYGAYDQFAVVEEFFNSIDNLFPIGRNGMHRYNNSDHSMLTAITAVENIVNGRTDKSNLWEINTEEDYHEEIE